MTLAFRSGGTLGCAFATSRRRCSPREQHLRYPRTDLTLVESSLPPMSVCYKALALFSGVGRCRIGGYWSAVSGMETTSVVPVLDLVVVLAQDLGQGFGHRLRLYHRKNVCGPTGVLTASVVLTPCPPMPLAAASAAARDIDTVPASVLLRHSMRSRPRSESYRPRCMPRETASAAFRGSGPVPPYRVCCSARA